MKAKGNKPAKRSGTTTPTSGRVRVMVLRNGKRRFEWQTVGE